MRPIQPRVEAEFTVPAASPTTKRHRLVACVSCRSRKIACDGVRPTCKACERKGNKCHYPTSDESETRRQALLRENKSFADLIKSLSTAPPVTAQAILYELRQSADPLSVLRRYETGQLLDSTVTLPTSASIPHMCSVAELRLMLRHPIVYPALDLSYDAIISKRTLVEDAGATGVSDEDQDMGPSTEGKDNRTIQDDALRVSDPSTSTRSRMPDSSTSMILAALMDHLRISYWTNVPVTNRYAAAAMSLYLEGDHQLLNLFDAGLFLNDLINLRSNYCSPFLVNSVLAMASQSYSGHDSTAAARSLEFEQEAQLLWRTDRSDSISNLAGLILLFIAIGSNGNADSSAASYVSEASEMAKRMKLFGVEDRITAIQLRHFITNEAAEDDQQAHSQTAWGVFNAYNMGVHLGIAQPLEYPPTLATPQPRGGLYFEPARRRFAYSASLVSPRYEAFKYSCQLGYVDAGILLVLRNPDVKQPAPLAFAYARYAKLVDLMASLPSIVRRTGDAPLSVLYMHSYFHQIVTDLFRPYASKREIYVHAHHPDFGSPRDIFRASAQQLKALVLEFISKPRMVFQSVMWHTTLIYAANAVLEDTSQPAWRFFYLLIIHSYVKLYKLYPLAESAVQSLLSMATNLNAISLSEARNIFSTTILVEKAKKLQPEFTTQKNTYVSDLTRATSDREAAGTASLAKRFGELVMSGESAEDLL